MSLKNIVFLQYGAEQECAGYIFAPRVRNARAALLQRGWNQREKL
jgi:hypothetical protein